MLVSQLPIRTRPRPRHQEIPQQQGPDPQAAPAWVVAHRGSAQKAIENTLPAFRQAVADGADALELDVHLTKDKDLAVIHDDTLDRTFGRPGEVREMTSQELREVGVPMLSEVLELGEHQLVVEIKHPKGGRHEGIEQILVDQLEQAKADERTLVISFDETSLKKVHELDPGLETGYLYSGHPINFKQTKEELGISYIEPHFKAITRDYVRRAHQNGLKVNTWTVDEQRDIQRMIAYGVDAITTNDTPGARKLVDGEAL
jgi:glycerophosphoryl diester phosphodiesterase